MEEITCRHCGAKNPADLRECQTCGTIINPKGRIIEEEVVKERFRAHKFKKLTADGLSVWLRLIGWLYFIISFLGGIVLIVNAQGTYDTPTNYVNIALGIVGIMTSAIVVSFLCGIARIIDQNNFILSTTFSKGD